MKEYTTVVIRFYMRQMIPSALVILPMIFIIIRKRINNTKVGKTFFIILACVCALFFTSSVACFLDCEKIKSHSYYTIQYKYAEYNTKYHDEYPFTTPIVAVDYKGNEYALNDVMGFPDKAEDGTITYIKPTGLIIDYSGKNSRRDRDDPVS